MSEAIFHGHHDLPVNRRATAWQGFVIALVIATALPFTVTPLVEQVIPNGTPGFLLFLAINFVGSHFHVAATGWFYTDPEIRAHFRDRPIRYIVVPLVLICGTSLAFLVLGPAPVPEVIIVFTAWQLWHYQKQNVGLLSFVAAGTDSRPISTWERRTLMLATLPGILGVYSVVGIAPAGWTAELAHLLHRFGMTTYFLVAVAFCVAIIKTPALRSNWLRFAFFLAGTLFFLPTYLFSSLIAAYSSYALAHGFQYVVFMGVVGIARRRAVLTILKLLAIAGSGGFLLAAAMESPTWMTEPYATLVNGLFFGVVMSHFVLDAGIWRLREPFQRNYMRRKFAFVFAR